tara:strand:+ start:1584 stop:2498 length:915 start_codon:yes stop_codon:yes gene_type:complete
MVSFQTFDPDVCGFELSEAIMRDGCAIVNKAMSINKLKQLKSELSSHIDNTGISDPDPFMGHKTKRFGALLSRCPSTRDLVRTPLILEVADNILRPHCARYQINYTGIMHIEPGEQKQKIHRDTGFYPIQNPAPPLTLSTMWAISKFTADNGATRIIPGSHLWPDNRSPELDEVEIAEMPSGSVLLYLGNLLHGGGANKSDVPRCGLNLVYALGWLRQEENQYLAVPADEVKTFPPELQRLMGYDLGTVNLGFVDHKHPFDFINGTAGDGPGVLAPPDLMEDDNAVKRLKFVNAKASKRARFKV